MNWPEQQPPPPHGYPPPPPHGYPPPPPAPADSRIKAGVRQGQAFPDPVDAARAVRYAEGFLKNANDLVRAPVLGAVGLGLLLTLGIQIAVGNVFAVVVPLGGFLALIAWVVWLSLHRKRVEQALHANRRVLGG
jgi:hypothetical protein